MKKGSEEQNKRKVIKIDVLHDKLKFFFILNFLTQHFSVSRLITFTLHFIFFRASLCDEGQIMGKIFR